MPNSYARFRLQEHIKILAKPKVAPICGPRSRELANVVLEQQIAQQYSARMKAKPRVPTSGRNDANRNFSHPHYKAPRFVQKKLKGVRKDLEHPAFDSAAVTTLRDPASGTPSQYQTEDAFAPSSNQIRTERVGASHLRVSLRSPEMALRSSGNHRGMVGFQSGPTPDEQCLYTIEDSQTY